MTRATPQSQSQPQSQPYHRSASATTASSSSRSTSSSSRQRNNNQHQYPSSSSSSTSMKTTFHRHASTGGIISGSGSSLGGGGGGIVVGSSTSSSSSHSLQPKVNTTNRSNHLNAATATSLPPPSTPSSTSPSVIAEDNQAKSSSLLLSTPESTNATTTTTTLLPSFLSFILQWFYQILMRIPFYGYSRRGNINDRRCNNNNNNNIVDNDVIKALLLERKRALISAENEDGNDDDDNNNNNDYNSVNIGGKGGHEVDDGIFDVDTEEYLRVKASPGLTTLLDNELYRAYKAELLPTVVSASQLLSEFIEMKETSALILRECRWMVGVPFSGGMTLCKCTEDDEEEVELVAVGGAVLHDVCVGEGAVVDTNGMPVVDYLRTDIATSEAVAEAMQSEDITNWNEFDTIQDFAQQCYLAAKEAIHRLTTDRLADSANRTLQDSLVATSLDGAVETTATGVVHTTGAAARALAALQSSPSITQPSAFSQSSSPMDAGIGRCYPTQRRRDCWESPHLYCPDYYWADDAIGGCQRLLKNLSKHRFVTLVNNHGWERYSSIKPKTVLEPKDSKQSHSILHSPTYASSTPHVFPSFEAVHALQYLVSELLSTSIPSRLNQFRAATESNAVVSKRLYLVKAEYRAPMRALWESCMNLKAAPKAELVERYLREYHSVKVGSSRFMESGVSGVGGGGGGIVGEGEIMSGGGKSLSGRRRSTIDSTDATKKTILQQQREKLEKLITERYWKHPAFVEALQLERCCEQLEMEMAQILLPFANLASEIMNNMKGRLRAVTVVNNNATAGQDDEESSSSAGTYNDPVRALLRWQDVPFMRELLRRLKSILRRKPDLDESIGIRPLLLDLQGVPRHKQDPIDSSIEMSFFPSFVDTSNHLDQQQQTDEWFHLDQFVVEVGKLIDLLTIPNTPFVIDDRVSGTKGGDKHTLHDLIEQCKEVWNAELFCAQYKDWYDMVKRQQELNAGCCSKDTTTDERNPHETSSTTSLCDLSESIRQAEIELSIAMASKEQLERVYTRIEALRADKAARYKVMAQIVFDVGYRELNHGILVETPPGDDETIEFPQLSVPRLLFTNWPIT